MARSVPQIISELAKEREEDMSRLTAGFDALMRKRATNAII